MSPTPPGPCCNRRSSGSARNGRNSARKPVKGSARVPKTGDLRWALVLLLFALPARAEVTIPVVGRPTPFYQAAGRNVTIDAIATPVTLTLDDSIIFTLTIGNL